MHTENKAAADRHRPNLWGIALQRVASLPSFSYSPSLAKLSPSRRDFEALSEFLKQPTEYATGTYWHAPLSYLLLPQIQASTARLFKKPTHTPSALPFILQISKLESSSSRKGSSGSR
ncbi:MAG: c-type cytochrome [Candidatus Hodgkinia cicadicola]